MTHRPGEDLTLKTTDNVQFATGDDPICAPFKSDQNENLEKNFVLEELECTIANNDHISRLDASPGQSITETEVIDTAPQTEQREVAETTIAKVPSAGDAFGPPVVMQYRLHRITPHQGMDDLALHMKRLQFSTASFTIETDFLKEDPRRNVEKYREFCLVTMPNLLCILISIVFRR